MNTTKLLLSAIMTTVILLTTHSSKAQETNPVTREIKGRNFVNLGVGIGTFGFTGTGGMPIVASVEHGFTDKISAGVYLGLIKRKFGSDLTYSYKVFGAKAAYHFNEALNISNPRLDTYGGAALYYRAYSLKYKDQSDPEDKMKSSGGDLTAGVYAGGRYFFAQNVGAFAEIGYGISPLQLGITFGF